MILETKVYSLVPDCLNIREENVNLKVLVVDLRRNTASQRENTKNENQGTEGTGGIIRNGNGSQIGAMCKKKLM